MRYYSAYLLFSAMGGHGFFHHISDERYVRIQYRLIMKKKLNTNEPKLMNEKLQWLKLNDRKSEYTMMADKLAVRDYVAKIIGKEHLIPLLGTWNDADDIVFEHLPDKFVLKCNHDSGGVVICRDKTKFDEKAARKTLRKKMKRNYYWGSREWPYKDISRKIICEKYMTDETNNVDLTDYKFYCFNGVADCVLACYDRASGNPQYFFFDRDWNLLRYNIQSQTVPSDFTIPKPQNLDEMFETANKLASAVGNAFLRVDLYSINGKIYFGELTLYPHSGTDDSLLQEVDALFGEKIVLPKESALG